MSPSGRLRLRWFALFVAATSSLVLASCAGASCPGGVVDVPTRPPPPLPEEPQTPPTENMTWIAGYWHYGPSPEAIWVWVPGHWTTAPKGERWIAAKTTEGDKQYRYQPGGFCR